jgi:hypothetical protein
MTAERIMKKWETLFSLGALALCLATGCVVNQESGLIGDGTTEPNNTPNLTAASTAQVISVGYCPTMAAELSILDADGVFIEGVQYPSAAQAVQALQDGAVDAVLIGRKPYATEISEGLVFIQMREGVTMINVQQRIIPYAELASLHVHTTLDLKDIDGLFPESTQIIHHTEPVSVVLLDHNSAVLMEWADVEGNYQLLIPVNEQGQKIPQFRTPFLVYDASNAENLQTLIANVSDAFPS